VCIVIVIGVAGSVLGRYILLLYAPILASKYLKAEKMHMFSEIPKRKQMEVLVVLATFITTYYAFLRAGIKNRLLTSLFFFNFGKFTRCYCHI
jgi:hypothetical protein